MRMTGLGRWGAAAAMVMAMAPVALAQKQSETIDKTVPLPSNGTVKVRNFSGVIHITGTNGRDVVVKAVRTAERDRLDHIKLDISTSGSTVTIDANNRDDSWNKSHHDDNVVHTDFEIQVPSSSNLDVYGFSSELTVAGVSGTRSWRRSRAE